jgi:isopentenyl diphosphate isomerase/L-lactate dehydrogenase-like FMN-dependent dehydrogenase
MAESAPALICKIACPFARLQCSMVTDSTRSFKALALGADFVQLGRPILWGLAHEGEKGVRHVLKSMLADFEVTIGLAGYASLADVNASLLVRN